MGIEIIQDHTDTRRFGIDTIGKIARDVGKIQLGALLCHFAMSPTSQGFDHPKRVPGSVALIFIIDALHLSRTGG